MVGIAEACPPADTDKEEHRRRQVVEDHAGYVGRVWSERSERSPPNRNHPPDETIYTR